MFSPISKFMLNVYICVCVYDYTSYKYKVKL